MNTKSTKESLETTPQNHTSSNKSYVNNEDVALLSSRFDTESDRQIAGEFDGPGNGHTYNLGRPSVYLLSTGVPDLPITLQSSILNEKANAEEHHYDLTEVKGLVLVIQKPWAIFKYGNEAKAQNLIIGISKNDKQFLVGLSLRPKLKSGTILEINSIRNVLPKDNNEWLSWIQTKKALRIDAKEKIQAVIDALRINPVDYSYLDLNLISKLVKEFKNPKLVNK